MADPELVARIAASTDLTAQEADRVIEDVLAWYREPLTDFVRRRHAQQQAAGVRNEQIYRQLAAEIGRRLFAAPDLSIRQLRRIIYG